MKKLNNILWGVALLAVGIIVALNILGVTDVSLWFDGWWTLFIIIPSLIGLTTEKDKTGNLIGLCVGAILLLGAQDVLDFSMAWKLIVPAIIIIIAVKFIVKGIRSENQDGEEQNADGEKADVPSGFAAFSGNDMDFSNRVFEGAELNAIFGGIKCDLRNAIIEKNCEINLSAIFGGVDILLPENVNVILETTSIFGGVSDKRISKGTGTVTIRIKGLCMFGGADIK